MIDFQNRVDIKGSLDAVVNDICLKYGLGALKQHDIIEVGYEDLNIKLQTDNGVYLAKIFSKNRGTSEVDRFVKVVESALAAGVSHPQLLKNHDGGLLYSNGGVSAVVMQYINGETFYDLGRAPNDAELKKIVNEVVKLNRITYEPSYIFDSWAIPNIKLMFEKTKNHLSPEGKKLAQRACDMYSSVPIEKLPTGFVHGDIIKTNVIVGDDGKIYIIDFSVCNTYPRIQELAVMASSLMFDEKAEASMALAERLDKIINMYQQNGGELEDIEIDNALNYALAASAMEYMGAVNLRVNGDDSAETAHWENLGLNDLKESLSSNP